MPVTCVVNRTLNVLLSNFISFFTSLSFWESVCLFHGSIRTVQVHITYESFYLAQLHLASDPIHRNRSSSQIQFFSIRDKEQHSWNLNYFFTGSKEHQQSQQAPIWHVCTVRTVHFLGCIRTYGYTVIILKSFHSSFCCDKSIYDQMIRRKEAEETTKLLPER